MKYPNSKRTRNQAIILLYQTNAELTMVEIGQIFPNDGKPLSKQRVCQIIRRHHTQRTCLNCYYSTTDDFCACRDARDMVRTANKCTDWMPREREQEWKR